MFLICLYFLVIFAGIWAEIIYIDNFASNGTNFNIYKNLNEGLSMINLNESNTTIILLSNFTLIEEISLKKNLSLMGLI